MTVKGNVGTLIGKLRLRKCKKLGQSHNILRGRKRRPSWLNSPPKPGHSTFVNIYGFSQDPDI